ncbi:MAG TPA: hypothetical protein VLH19_02630 [Patescibacteria group bacterium]|nr:hypothetical protein [Patescibacteria group bacterium]
MNKIELFWKELQSKNRTGTVTKVASHSDTGRCQVTIDSPLLGIVTNYANEGEIKVGATVAWSLFGGIVIL